MGDLDLGPPSLISLLSNAFRRSIQVPCILVLRHAERSLSFDLVRAGHLKFAVVIQKGQ